MELLPASQILYTADKIGERLGLQRRNPRVYLMKNGSGILLRPWTTDRKVFEEIFGDKVYEEPASLIQRGRRPSVLLDLGANIGLSALYLDRRFHFDRVICVEPDSGNANVLRQNLAGNLKALTVIEAFVGAAPGFARLHDSGHGEWGFRLGESSSEGIPVIPLRDLLPEEGNVLLKCDIEGAERYFFPQIAEWDSQVSFIILELHTEFFSWNQLLESLHASRYEWRIHGRVEPGAVLAVLALERGARKMETVTLQSGSDSRNYSRRPAPV